MQVLHCGNKNSKTDVIVAYQLYHYLLFLQLRHFSNHSLDGQSINMWDQIMDISIIYATLILFMEFKLTDNFKFTCDYF